jgi:hypothetical protein
MKEFRLPLNLFRKPDVITIEECDKCCGCGPNSSITGGTFPTGFMANEVDFGKFAKELFNPRV